MLVRFLSGKKGKRGSAVIETALCLPVLLFLLFFIIEAIRITIYQIAMDQIALEAAFEYSAYKTTDKFEEIKKRNFPFSAMVRDDIRYYIRLYPNLNALVSSSIFGDNVSWPRTNVAASNVQASDNMVLVNNRVPARTAVELVVVCDYKFTNAFVSKLFAGGSNSADGKHFFIWSRAVCVCN